MSIRSAYIRDQSLKLLVVRISEKAVSTVQRLQCCCYTVCTVQGIALLWCSVRYLSSRS